MGVFVLDAWIYKFWGENMVQMFSASEDIDLLNAMDNVEELYNHDWDPKMGIFETETEE